ncbi:MAG: hypothetical protein WGN25_19160 [Candidatus Electrothrix sp. GW3-4]|uniref:hypothetical protein n=1 Tax=Candidatus Electrothrix sp. GW3-4 TaxID=3126740 RepID=UPI0030D3CEA7
MKQCSILVEEFNWMALLLKYSQASMVERAGSFVNGKYRKTGSIGQASLADRGGSVANNTISHCTPFLLTNPGAEA